MPIQPNGKKFLDAALPKDKSGYDLAVRELHTAHTHLDFFAENMHTLAGEHNLGTIGLEYAPYMMLFFWAHRDGKIDDQTLQNVMVGYSNDSAYIENTRANVAAIIQAHANHVEAVAFDSRRSFGETKNKYSQEMDFVRQNPRLGFAKLDSSQEPGFVLVEAQKLYDSNPDYANKLNAIEDMIRSLQMRGIPADTISATLASKLAVPDKNMITVSGAQHLGGWKVGLTNTAGIFDEALAKQNWHVTDAMMGNRGEVNKEIAYMDSEKYRCNNYDLIDGIYITGKNEDRWIHGFVPPPKEKQNTVSIQEAYLQTPPMDNASCTDSPPVETTFKPKELDPMRDFGAKLAIKRLSEELHPPPLPEPKADSMGNTACQFWKNIGVPMECDSPTPPPGKKPSNSASRNPR